MRKHQKILTVERVMELEKRLSQIPEVAKFDVPDEPQGHTLLTQFGAFDQSWAMRRQFRIQYERAICHLMSRWLPVYVARTPCHSIRQDAKPMASNTDALQQIQRAQIFTRFIEAAAAKGGYESPAISQPFDVDLPFAPTENFVIE
jgi:hypothetical protein